MQDDNQIPEASIQAALQDAGGANPMPQGDNQNGDWGHPGTPMGDQAAPNAPAPMMDQPEPAMPTEPVQDLPAPALTPQPQAEMGGSLDDIKQRAIGDLSPLLEHLDQTPEDKFRTTMMMIQATDNQDLIPAAYEAANAIPEEKAKAQALLDVINEVNYFTQHPQHNH